MNRREVIKLGLYGAGALWANSSVADSRAAADRYKLLPPDRHGVRLPAGFRSRIVAESTVSPVGGCEYVWHAAPDGGACFADAAGGWIYVSNSETDDQGGAGALRFDASGKLIDAYPILQGTRRNCAGGATPWGRWLSCEEVDDGRVWECDPRGIEAAVVRPALGVFRHEAVAVDPLGYKLYLTEDRKNGYLYRFTPFHYPDLDAGILEAARVVEGETGRVEWLVIEDPSARKAETRFQADATRFNGGEGIVYYNGKVYFTTKGDNRVWAFDITSQNLSILYDDSAYLDPVLTGVDNITVSADGTFYVAEDGGDLQVVVIATDGSLYPLLELAGHGQSEITGLAFSPDGSRLYFSSQRGKCGEDADGVTFEVSGPF
ncbi:MAG: alkaline phosphatase PhoX [Gammaproteobacteria bacterium]